MNKKRESGFTLIEVMVVMVIGIVIIAVATGGVRRAFAGNEVNTETRNVNDLMANIQAMKGVDGFSSISTQLLHRVHGIPTALSTTDGTSVLNSWNGAVTIRGNGTAFTINYAAVPESACIQLATKIAEAGAMRVHVGSTPITNSGEASGACTSSSNSMAFTFNATSPVS